MPQALKDCFCNEKMPLLHCEALLEQELDSVLEGLQQDSSAGRRLQHDLHRQIINNSELQQIVRGIRKLHGKQDSKLNHGSKSNGGFTTARHRQLHQSKGGWECADFITSMTEDRLSFLAGYKDLMEQKVRGEFCPSYSCSKTFYVSSSMTSSMTSSTSKILLNNSASWRLAYAGWPSPTDSWHPRWFLPPLDEHDTVDRRGNGEASSKVTSIGAECCSANNAVINNSIHACRRQSAMQFALLAT
jgi:hypothetical protein